MLDFSAVNDNNPPAQEGTAGFSPQISGHGKKGRNATSSFGSDSVSTGPDKPAETLEPTSDQDDGAKPRHAITSAAGRIKDDIV